MKFNHFMASLIIASLIISCNSNKQQPNEKKNKQNSNVLEIDEFERNDSVNYIENEYLKEKLNPIRKMVHHINTNKIWNKTRKIENSDAYKEYTKTLFYKDDSIVKIEIEIYEVEQQQKNEFYVHNNELIFVYENIVKYNRPIYYDSIEMNKNNDSVVFDIEKAVIIEDLSYFENGNLIRQINNQGSSAPSAKEYLLEEQKRLYSEFEKLNQ